MSQVELQSNSTMDNSELFSKAMSYSTGVGAEYDLVEAHKFFNLAALRGNEEAKSRRRELAEVMTELQIAAAQKAARDYLTAAKN